MAQNNFQQLVEMVMSNPGLSMMRPVVEKELLHYDIFEALDEAGLLRDLVFQGGTSLRLCRGAMRFSEDLDFAGGKNFSATQMSKIKDCIETHIGKRYGLQVAVKEPKETPVDPDNIKVDKWVISIETSPENRAMARQRIKLEIANVPAYTRELVPLLNNYEMLNGRNGVLVNTETVSEILADKVVAFPTSLVDREGKAMPLDSKKIRFRDVWDIAWLLNKSAKLDPELVEAKIADYGIRQYAELLNNAIEQIPAIINHPEFLNQMHRFIDRDTLSRTVERDGYLGYLGASVGGVFLEMRQYFVQKEKLPQWDGEYRLPISNGRYIGPVLGQQNNHVIQNGGQQIVGHDKEALAASGLQLKVQAILDIQYRGQNISSVSEIGQSVERGGIQGKGKGR